MIYYISDLLLEKAGVISPILILFPPLRQKEESWFLLVTLDKTKKELLFWFFKIIYHTTYRCIINIY